MRTSRYTRHKVSDGLKKPWRTFCITAAGWTVIYCPKIRMIYLFIVVYVQPSADRDKRTNHHPLNTHYTALEQNNDN